MFESSIITLLAADSALIADLSTYEGSPSIFTLNAPRAPDFNYIVIDVRSSGSEDSVIETFEVMTHVFGYAASSLTVSRIVRRLILLLHKKHLTHEYYELIRFYLDSCWPVRVDDVKAQHYVVNFSTRATNLALGGNM